MRITFTSKLVGNRVKEGSACSIIASFFDDSAADVWSASTPTTTKYRIDRIRKGDAGCYSAVLDWTSLSPATTNTIAITGAQNAIQNQYCPYETRQLTVKANDGLSTQYEESFQYTVQNLAGTT